jgi:hypothetical protein
VRTLRTLLAAIAACLRIFVVGYFGALTPPCAAVDAGDCLIRGLNGKNPENPEEEYRSCLLTFIHAEEEMLDDELTQEDIENAILKGCIEKRLSQLGTDG